MICSLLLLLIFFLSLRRNACAQWEMPTRQTYRCRPTVKLSRAAKRCRLERVVGLLILRVAHSTTRPAADGCSRGKHNAEVMRSVATAPRLRLRGCSHCSARARITCVM